MDTININKTVSQTIIQNNNSIVILNKVNCGGNIKVYVSKKKIKTYKKKDICYNEFIILHKFDCPYIIKTLGYNVSEKTVLLEYFQGVDLIDYVSTKKMTEQIYHIIFNQMVLAVTECHNKNIIHRDIKLDNFMIDDNLHVKMIDFEFAKNEKKCRTFCGTIEYMAPEILHECYYQDSQHSKKRYYSKKSDIWALGISLYSMITLSHPFIKDDDDGYESIVTNIIETEIDYGIILDKDLRELIKGMTTKNIKDRYDMAAIISSAWFNKIF